MTPNQLRKIAKLLYGKSWQTALAEDMNVNARTVRRWYSGDTAIPCDLHLTLIKKAEQKSKILLKTALQCPEIRA